MFKSNKHFTNNPMKTAATNESLRLSYGISTPKKEDAYLTPSHIPIPIDFYKVISNSITNIRMAIDFHLECPFLRTNQSLIPG